MTADLAPSEQVLWTGRPVRYPIFDITDWLIIPGWLVVVGGLVWNLQTRTSDTRLMLVGWVVVALVACMGVGQQMVRWLLLRGTTYTVTNERLLIDATLFGRTFRRGGYFRDMDPPKVVERSPGFGDVRFGESTAWRRTGTFRWRRSFQGPLMLRAIENPERVDDLIMQAY